MDDIERGHRVDLMARVYQSANIILIWLGQDQHRKAKLAFRLIGDLNDHCEQEIAKYGDISKVPPLGLFALLDVWKWNAVQKLFYCS
jgi:hypothetical protein